MYGDVKIDMLWKRKICQFILSLMVIAEEWEQARTSIKPEYQSFDVNMQIDDTNK